MEAVRRDPVGFARIQWDTWSPKGWFVEEDFMIASRYFDKPDWAEITLNAYRSRYLANEIVDHRYDELQTRLKNIVQINTPTLMIQGGSDCCDLPSASEGQDEYFLKSYQRIVLDGVGHFPHREAPAMVADAALHLLRLHNA